MPSPSPASEMKSPEQRPLDLGDEYTSRVIKGIKEEEEDRDDEDGDAAKADGTPRSKSIGLQTDSEVGSHRTSQSDHARHMPSKTPKTPGRSSEFFADDEHEDEDDGWPTSRTEGAPLEAVAEVSIEQPSRKESMQSRTALSKYESKTATPSRPESKEDPSASQSLDQSKSIAPSVTSDRKSSLQKGDKTAPSSATPSKKAPSAALSVEEVAERDASAAGRKSTATSKAAKSAASEEAKRSISEKSKTKSEAKSVEKSQPSSAVQPGRDSIESKSPSKGESRSVSEKGDKSAKVGKSGRSSKRSKRADSQTKNASRATTGTKLSGAKLRTPPPTADADGRQDDEERFDDNPWGDDNEDYADDFEDGEDAKQVEMEDTEEYRMPSTPSEDNARISGEDLRRKSGGIDLTVEGQQLLTPPESPSFVKKRQSGEMERGSCTPDLI